MALSGSRKDLSKGVHDPLSARAISFEQEGKRLVLLSTDILGFYNETAEPLRQAILDATPLAPSELFLAAIHTHSAANPALDPALGHSNNVAYTQRLRGQLVQLVRDAIARETPVRLGWASGASPVGVNRRQVVTDAAGNPQVELGRNPTPPIDREVQVLRLTPSGASAPAAVLFAYSTHSTSLGPGNYLISGDVHGLAEQSVERYLGGGTIAPGFAGASGNIDPWVRVLPEFRERNGWIPEPVLLGTLLGQEVVRVAENLPEHELAGPVRTLSTTLLLPGKVAGEIRADADAPKRALRVSVGRVGPVAFVGLGGEVFQEIGQAIKRASPFALTVVITHCNGAAGYLPTAEAYLEGGYEVKSSRFASSAADQVVRETVRMLHGL